MFGGVLRRRRDREARELLLSSLEGWLARAAEEDDQLASSDEVASGDDTAPATE